MYGHPIRSIQPTRKYIRYNFRNQSASNSRKTINRRNETKRRRNRKNRNEPICNKPTRRNHHRIEQQNPSSTKKNYKTKLQQKTILRQNTNTNENNGNNRLRPIQKNLQAIRKVQQEHDAYRTHVASRITKTTTSTKIQKRIKSQEKEAKQLGVMKL